MSSRLIKIYEKIVSLCYMHNCIVEIASVKKRSVSLTSIKENDKNECNIDFVVHLPHFNSEFESDVPLIHSLYILKFSKISNAVH